MPVNIPSLHGRLLNIARDQKTDLQLLINRLAGEQFLYRLSLSSYVEKFVLKGGSLLIYLIESDRKTKDLDFTVQQINNHVDDMVTIIRSVLDIAVDDGIKWGKIEGTPLMHPEMPQPGVRIGCHFLLGKMRGMVHMDMAMGEVIEGTAMMFHRMKYRNQPIFGEPFSLLAYPPELVFAEKLQIVVRKKGQNTRMKDYYDLSKLIEYNLDREKLKKAIQDVFNSRKITIPTRIQFHEAEHSRLQTYWEHFLKRDQMERAPKQIQEIIDILNAYLKKLNE